MKVDYAEQVGSYTIEYVKDIRWEGPSRQYYRVMAAGASKPISEHDSKIDAWDAVERYQAADNFRKVT